MSGRLLANASCVAIGGRGLLIEGPPGRGKSSLALALIDRGASLVGDDGMVLELRDLRLWAAPPPHIAGSLEIRGVGIISLPVVSTPLCLVLALTKEVPRLPEVGERTIMGATLPALDFVAATPDAALRAEWAMRLHGLALPDSGA